MSQLNSEPPLSPERDFLAEAEEMLEHLERYQELLEEVKDDSDFPQFTVWGQHLLMTVGYLAASIRRLEENILNMRLESGRHYD